MASAGPSLSSLPSGGVPAAYALAQHVQLTVKLEGSAPAPDMTVPPSSRLVSSAELPSSDRSEYETKMLKLSETIAAMEKA